MMTATELFKTSSDALAITGPAEWDSPDAPGQRDALVYVDDEAAEDGPLWCLAPPGSDDADYLPMDATMARELIESHLRAWLLSRGWQVQVTTHKQTQRWRLVDSLSFADGGGDRLDNDYPYGNDELTVLCESVVVLAAS
ncbi:MAG: hypothetical protein IIC01_03180 [Planctomycetes bacterium]|nr:hypothetical protein [Planctomycetota bacterium]